MNVSQFILLAIKRRLSRVNDVSTTGSINSGAWISGSIISGDVSISQGCKIFKAELAGSIVIDRYTSIWGPSVHVDAKRYGVQIGAFCSIAHHVFMHETFHNIQRTTSYFVEKNLFQAAEHLVFSSSSGAH